MSLWPFNLSPSFWTNRKPGNGNRRYRCSDKTCPHKTTKGQLKVNGGVCFSCKSPITR
jgi:hypothetical protein